MGCGFHSSPASTGEPGAPDAGSGSSAGSGFDVSTCPASYVSLPGFPATSRYRVIVSGADADDQSDHCNGDMPDRTHLIVVSSLDEVRAVSGLVDGVAGNAIARNTVWIGGVQQRTAALPDQGWLGFDDRPLINAWERPEPNDGQTEDDHSEQFVELQRGRRYLADVPRNTKNAAICECDGAALGPLAAAAIDTNR
jgi:hypothetical protein